MDTNIELFLLLAEALGIGLLIGIERERSIKTTGIGSSAGVRTFALASLIGAISMMAGGIPLLAVAIISVAAVRSEWDNAITQNQGMAIEEEANTGTVISGELLEMATQISKGVIT